MNTLKKYVFANKAEIINLLHGLVAYYKFNDNLIDSASLSPTGTSVSTTYDSGVIDKCISFPSGVASYVDIANDANFSFTNGSGNDIPFTISFWVNMRNINPVYSGSWLLNKRGGGDNCEYQVTLNIYGAITLIKFSGGTTSNFQRCVTHEPFIPFTETDKWFHIAISDDGSKSVGGIKMYVNGNNAVLDDESVGMYVGMDIGTSKTRIGSAAWVGSADLKFDGKFDEFGVWKNRALNQMEINYLYNNGAGRTYPF